MTNILSELDAHCRPEVATERVVSLFAEGTRCDYRLTAPLREVGLPGPGELSQNVHMTIGKPADEGYAITIPLEWHADNPFFPLFQGMIEISSLDDERVQLSVIGHYAPPAGVVGQAFDAAIGKRVAQVTIDRFLGALRAAAEANSQAA